MLPNFVRDWEKLTLCNIEQSDISKMPNQPFDIGLYAPPDTKTGDLIHSYYREQYQINGGTMDRFAYWSDAKGLSLGYYDTSALPLARWAREYVLADKLGFDGVQLHDDDAVPELDADEDGRLTEH
jgi:phospholipase C